MPKPWPNDIPPDLRKRLDRVLSYRSWGAADLWGEVREWLADHALEPPETLPHHVPEGDKWRE